MESAFPLINLRTQLCLIFTGFGSDRQATWPPAAEEFLRRMHKLGLQITVIGPRPPNKIGSKKNLRFLDRHEVLGMKVLAASRSHQVELRVLNNKSKSWTRLRAEACVTVGPHGLWPVPYNGWTLPGTMTIQALSRWVIEQKAMPGREFAFIGSSNQVFRWASLLLDRGVKRCYVIEQDTDLKCWQAYRDRFVAKGGRVLLKHKIQRVEPQENNSLKLYLENEQGTLLIDSDIIVLSSTNDNALNYPEQWKQGLFYIQRRSLSFDQVVDEEQWLELIDWRELYWRIAKRFEFVDYAEAEGALKTLRSERRKMTEYRRRNGLRRDLSYSGKILDRDSLAAVQSSQSTPRSFAHAKPMASLECMENLACRACADACPESAIEISALIDQPRLLEDKCTGCGACVAICPSGAAVMVKELPLQQKGRYFFADDSKELWRTGRQLQLLNRKGDVLGTGRVVNSTSYDGGLHRVLEIESTNVHLWDARNYRINPAEPASFEDPQITQSAQHQAKRGWIQLNGAKRLVPIDVPITVALWNLGQRRFEDALFCQDGSCQLCEVTVDGKHALACKTLLRDGQKIEFTRKIPSPENSKGLLCPCKEVTATQYEEFLTDSTTPTLAREITGLGCGACHGRWCLSSEAKAIRTSDNAEPSQERPVFHGYEASPWRDVWADDLVLPERGGRGSSDDTDFDE